MRAIRSKRCTMLLAWGAVALAAPAQATIYTWTDARGGRHYSDTTRPPGAQQAQLAQRPISGDSPRSTPASGSSDTPAGDARALSVISPQPGQLFVNAPGQVPVSVIVDGNDDNSGLDDGESLRYELDGTTIGQGPTQDTRLTLSNVAAGAHTISVTLLYRGHAVQHSGAVSFRVERRPASTSSTSSSPAAHGRPPS